MFNSFKFIVLLSVFISFFACNENRNNFYVHNNDPIPIDSLHFFVEDRTYLVEDLQPGQTKGIKITNIGGSQIVLQADHEKPMQLRGGFLSPQAKGMLRIIITRTQIVSSNTHQK